MTAIDLLYDRIRTQPEEGAIKNFAIFHLRTLIESDHVALDDALQAVRAFFTLGLSDFDEIARRARQKYGTGQVNFHEGH